MAKLIKRKKRNKFIVALMSPILAIVFIVGWSLYYIGRLRQPKVKQQQQKQNNKKPAHQNEIELIAIPNEEIQTLEK